jgi:hypothetical protein
VVLPFASSSDVSAAIGAGGAVFAAVVLAFGAARARSYDDLLDDIQNRFSEELDRRELRRDLDDLRRRDS